jgi:hypothetical protein
MVGTALLAWGFFAATFLGAGYLCLTLIGLAALTRREFWGSAGDAASGRFVLTVVSLIFGAYALAGLLGWSPADEVDFRTFVTGAARTIAVVAAAIVTMLVGFSVWVRGLLARDGRRARAYWTKVVAVGLFALAAAIAGGGLMGLALLQ